MSAEAAKDAGDFDAGFLGVLGALRKMWRQGRPLTDIPVAETAQAVIALHDALE